MIRAYRFLPRPTVRQAEAEAEAEAEAQAQAEMLRGHCSLYNGAFLLRLAHLAHLAHRAAGSAEAERRPGDTTFTRFRDAVERGFADNHSVSAYADALGYSRRTLVRAVRAATGEAPKGFVDQRVVLEAKRLSAHTELPDRPCGRGRRLPRRGRLLHVLPAVDGDPHRWRSGRRCGDPAGRAWRGAPRRCAEPLFVQADLPLSGGS